MIENAAEIEETDSIATEIATLNETIGSTDAFLRILETLFKDEHRYDDYIKIEEAIDQAITCNRDSFHLKLYKSIVPSKKWNGKSRLGVVLSWLKSIRDRIGSMSMAFHPPYTLA